MNAVVHPTVHTSTRAISPLPQQQDQQPFELDAEDEEFLSMVHSSVEQ